LNNLHRRYLPRKTELLERKPNPDLLTIFQITVVGVLLELIAITLRPSLLTILCYSIIIYWLFLGYYDKMFMTNLIGAVGASILFDLIYVILQATNSVNTSRPSNSGFNTVAVIFLVIGLGLRGILVVKLLEWREPSQKVEYFEVFGEEI